MTPLNITSEFHFTDYFFDLKGVYLLEPNFCHRIAEHLGLLVTVRYIKTANLQKNTFFESTTVIHIKELQKDKKRYLTLSGDNSMSHKTGQQRQMIHFYSILKYIYGNRIS